MQIIQRQNLGKLYSKQDQILIFIHRCSLPLPQLSGFLWKLSFQLFYVPLSFSPGQETLLLKLELRICSHFVTQIPSALLSKSLYLLLSLSKWTYKESGPTLPALGRYYHLQITALQVEETESKYNEQVLDFFVYGKALTSMPDFLVLKTKRPLSWQNTLSPTSFVGLLFRSR